MPSSSLRESPYKPPTLTAAMVLLSTILAILLGGCTVTWAKGCLFILIGLTLLVTSNKNQNNSHRGLNFCFILFFILALCAFLPNALTPTPAWRQVLSEDFSLKLGSLHSAQPWLSAEYLLYLGGGLLWFHFLCQRHWSSAERRWLMQSLSIVISALVLASIVLYKLRLFVDIWGWDVDPSGQKWRQFGPFANLNHMGCLIATGAVCTAACAYDLQRRKRKSWWVFAALILILLFGIILCDSRGGMLMFFGAVSGWLVLISLNSKSKSRLAVAASFFLITTTIFFRFGRDLLKSLSSSGNTLNTVLGDGRIPIYQDSVKMITEQPLLGTALGNFEGVFAVSRHFYENTDRPLHPESSWIWMTVELGIPATMIALIALYFTVKRLGSLKPRKKTNRYNHRLRIGALVAGMVVVLHSLIDIPGHVYGSIFPGLLLLGLSGKRKRRSSQEPELLSENDATEQSNALLQTPLFLARLSLLPLGVLLFLTGHHLISPPSKIASRYLYGQAVAQTKEPGARAYHSVNQAIAWNPLQWDNYHLRAKLGSRAKKSRREIAADFRRSRHLEQFSRFPPIDEANYWLQRYPPQVLSAWRELLSRDPARKLEHLGMMQAQCKNKPKLYEKLLSLVREDQSLYLKFLEECPQENFAEHFASYQDHYPDIKNLSPQEKSRFMNLWARRGDKQELLNKLQEKSDWMNVGWMIAATEQVHKKQYAAALKLAQRHHSNPEIPSSFYLGKSVKKLEKEFYHNPSDVSRGLGLLHSQLNRSDLTGADLTLSKLEKMEQAPDYLPYLKATLLSKKGKYREAWEQFLHYYRSS